MSDHEKPSDRRKELMATCGVKPELRHSRVARDFINEVTLDDESEWKDTLQAFVGEGTAPPEEKLKTVSRMLASQAITLDAIFTSMAQRAAANLGQYPEAVDHYMKHALKAQAGSRAALEALARLHQPREQVVKHVTVNEGGQAVVAENFHHHRAGDQNEKTGHQPHVCEPPLLGENAGGNSVSIGGDEGKAAMPAPRRKGHRRSQGK